MRTPIMNRLAILLIAGLLLTGCVPGDTVREDDPELAALVARSQADPKDQLTRSQLIDAYLKRLNQTKQVRYRDKAIEELRIFLADAPEHTGANVTLYQLLANQSVQQASREHLAELRVIYERTPILLETPMAPPSLLDAAITLQTANKADDLKAAIGLARQGLKENPRHIGSRLLLAKLYRELGNDALAMAMLEQAHKLAPDHPAALAEYGNALYQAARASRCSGGSPHLDKAITVVKQASVKKPEDSELLFRLSKLYEMRGRHELALFTAKRLVDAEDNPDNRLFLAEQYNLADRRDEAVAAYQALMAQQPGDPSLLDGLAHVHFQRAEWQRARELLLQHVDASDTPHAYAVMLLSLTERLRGDDDAARKHLRGLPVTSFDNDWERTLVRFLAGDIDEAALHAAANDTCNQVEAHYFAGFSKWIAGDNAAARADFEKVIALNVPFFYEHHSARYLIDRLDTARGG